MSNRPMPVIRCPTCKKEGGDQKFLPFCSNRCKQLDFGAWVTEKYKVSSPLIGDENEDSLEPQDPPVLN